jgi:aflatoxin B1 aldehyde reductase
VSVSHPLFPQNSQARSTRPNSTMTSPTLIFGGATIGQNFPTASSVQALLDLLKQHQITHIDTADRYPPGKFGLSETLLGEVQAANQGFSISTKIFMDPAAGNGEGELTPEAIERSLAGSLGRLRVRQVDILYCHRPDPQTPLLEQAAALDSQYRKGVFKRVSYADYHLHPRSCTQQQQHMYIANYHPARPLQLLSQASP